jgi:hypothetical protein
MSKLIKALQIFLKYGDSVSPTGCEHGVLYVNIDPNLVSAKDRAKLEKLHFIENNGEFQSTYFGSY